MILCPRTQALQLTKGPFCASRTCLSKAAVSFSADACFISKNTSTVNFAWIKRGAPNFNGRLVMAFFQSMKLETGNVQPNWGCQASSKTQNKLLSANIFELIASACAPWFAVLADQVIFVCPLANHGIRELRELSLASPKPPRKSHVESNSIPVAGFCELRHFYPDLSGWSLRSAGSGSRQRVHRRLGTRWNANEEWVKPL